MVILKSLIFEQFPEIIFGFNTKIGARRNAPYYFNVSFSVGDDENIVKENRNIFFSSLGLSEATVAYQTQVHGDIIKYVDKPGNNGESDAMITAETNLGLAISTADCTPIFICDKKNKVIAGVHSGWRSTEKRIMEKTLLKLKEDFNSNPGDLIVYMGPSISRENYEVGKEVAELFDSKYTKPNHEKFSLDVACANYDMLLKFGVNKKNIQKSELCTYNMKHLLHSYRRDGLKSGRSLGIIAMKG
ncbi:MAG: peptidoglycan editing factor PgeF [Ignavibacteriaceae bacterium]